ncbi:MAG TPA: septation protein IspZ [Candidatus Paceibacterota bacterium]|nr:septation protein IspZ [Candidatus Paceibacterota bacterium]
MHRHLHSLINWSVEFGPILGFFISLYVRGDTKEGFLASTALFVMLTIAALLLAYLTERRLARFPLFAGLFVILFGSISVFLKDPLIFMVKDTVYNTLFAGLLFYGIYQGKGFLKSLFASLFDMTDQGWYILSLRWAIMFTVLAIGNEIVWRNFSPHVWVIYKLCATIATVLFGAYQLTLARRERNPAASKWGMKVHG